ncbi:hypothetical protein SLS56_011642 [Neofusicoccum ribis]|uniref:Uncharacterized protein n=1 Tax=Neofusicoccum ribis TaxID=45134 RepID=A0ABR3SB11_9PEZI
MAQVSPTRLVPRCAALTRRRRHCNCHVAAGGFCYFHSKKRQITIPTATLATAVAVRSVTPSLSAPLPPPPSDPSDPMAAAANEEHTGSTDAGDDDDDDDDDNIDDNTESLQPDPPDPHNYTEHAGSVQMRTLLCLHQQLHYEVVPAVLSEVFTPADADDEQRRRDLAAVRGHVDALSLRMAETMEVCWYARW